MIDGRTDPLSRGVVIEHVQRVQWLATLEWLPLLLPVMDNRGRCLADIIKRRRVDSLLFTWSNKIYQPD